MFRNGSAVWRMSKVLLLGSLAGATAGCQAFGALIYSTYGPLPVAAQYNIADQPTLLIVEDAQHFGMNELDADIIAKDLSDDLNENKALLVGSEKLQRLRDTDAPKYRSLTISDLARITGATQVLYVDLQNSTSGVESSGAAAQGKAAALVRVVSGSNGSNLWPPDERLGYPIAADQLYDPVDAGRLIEQHALLLQRLATNIGRLFHTYQPDNDDGPDSKFQDTAPLDVKKDM